MRRPCSFIPVNDRDVTPVLVPNVRSRTLEQIVANYMTTGDVSALESGSSDSFDFADSEHIDMDIELPQSMNKIDAILHFRNIRDSLRSPLQASGEDPKSIYNQASENHEVSSEANNQPSNPEGA